MPPQSPDLAALRSFLAILRSDSLSSAAQALGLTQSAVTKHLQKLERQIGRPLVDRSTRPFAPTPAGRALAQSLPRLLEALEHAFAQARLEGAALRQVIRIGMPDSLCEILGAEFMSMAQDIAGRVELRSGISPWLERSFHTRLFDLAVDSPPFDPALQATQTPLFRDPFVIVTPPGWRDTATDDLTRRENNVAYGRNSKFGTACAEIAQNLGLFDPPRFTLDSTQSLLRFVQSGYGWSITSALCLLQSPQTLRDIDIRPCPGAPCRTFVLLSRPAETGDIAQKAVARLQFVFRQLVLGPWDARAPAVTQLLRSANPDIIADHAGP